MARKSPTPAFDYDDVILIPGECIVRSRSGVDTSVEFGPRRFDVPVVPANMSTVIDETLACWLAENNLFYVMHRFDVDPVRFTQNMHEKGLYSSISLGIQAVDHETVQRWPANVSHPEYITVDIAHGHSSAMLEIIATIKSHMPNTFVIAGNVSTPVAVIALENAGADAVKVGIGPGSACTSSPNTGFGTRGWQLAAVEQCADAARTVLIIADGGISKYGDIAKSIAFGADMVMIGGMFSGHDESPGEIVEIDGEKFKEFFGSASVNQKGEAKHVEGRSMLNPYKGPISETYRTIRENLQSAVSYAGGEKVTDLVNVEYKVLNR